MCLWNKNVLALGIVTRSFQAALVVPLYARALLPSLFTKCSATKRRWLIFNSTPAHQNHTGDLLLLSLEHFIVQAKIMSRLQPWMGKCFVLTFKCSVEYFSIRSDLNTSMVI